MISRVPTARFDTDPPGTEDYQRLLRLRSGLRRFLRWSEELAESAGLTPMQHLLLLAVRGHEDPRGPAVSDVARHLVMHHNSAVQLIDRAESSRLLVRVPDLVDGRVVRLRLTAKGSRRLKALASSTKEELARLGPDMARLWDGLEHQ